MAIEECARANLERDIRTGWFSAYYANNPEGTKLQDELDKYIGGKSSNAKPLSGMDAINFFKALTLAQGGTVEGL